ncbi:hypothetical protein NMG60_11032164 [Bertholletia excelsa]
MNVGHPILLVSMLLALPQAGAQTTPPPPTSQYTYVKFSPSMAAIIGVLIAALFFMGFFSIYLRRRSDSSTGDSVRFAGLGASLRRRLGARGLEPTVIESFPTFVYSGVKGLKIGKGGLECAICLNEFEDDETLRLIPKCDHVFHPECIEAWLASHVTCPVCRANLVPQPGESVLDLHELEHPPEAPAPPENDVSIRILEDNQERSGRPRPVRRFSRSLSTGHVYIQPGHNTERFTLRLPEGVRKQVMSRALNRTTSCVVASTAGDEGLRRGYRTGGGEGRSYRRLDREAKSDRWVFSMTPPFFSRALSMKSPMVVAADGEGSTRPSTTPRGTRTGVKLPSFKCLEPKGDQTGLVSAGSNHSPV